MKKVNVLELKSKSAITTYIEILQNNISRMCTYSMNVKAYMGVMYTILITLLIYGNCISKYWWLGIVIVVPSLLLDAYYLAFEKIYVEKYNSFVNKINAGIVDYDDIYDMQPKNTNLKCELLAEMLVSLKSFSIWGYYIIFVVVSVIVGGKLL